MTTDHMLAPVDAADVLCITSYVRNISRNAIQLETVFTVDGGVYTNLSDGKTYRWTITERQIGGADVETASLREVEFVNGEYTETGNSL